MPDNRTMAICVGLSLLAHLLFATLAALIPITARTVDEVMVVDLADLPRVADFLPPKPGILNGVRPKALPPAPAARPREEAPPKIPSRTMEGRVPDLPVDPALPPEKTFPPPRARETAEKPLRVPPAQPARVPPAPVEPRAPGSGGKPIQSLTPSLGKVVISMGERGGRGAGNTAGDTVGTASKGKDRAGIVEEGGATFQALNAPEIQYISYFAGIKRKIELLWVYPATAAGIEGEVVIDFVIGRSGSLDAVRIIQGSGHKVLDDEALSAIRKASPYDPIPAMYKIPNLQVRGHFLYTVTATRILR